MRTVKRPVSVILATSGMLMISAASFAQAPSSTSTKPTVDSYLCTFAGVCGDQPTTPAVTKDAPATKGFRLARSATPTAAATSVSAPAPATRGFRLARSAAAPAPAAAPAARFALAKPTPRMPVRVPVMASIPRAPRANLSIAFELGSDRMTPDGVATARVFYQSLMTSQLRDQRFLIEGHTDSTGDAARNLDLSRRRAKAVADFLISQNVDPARLEVKGFGSAAPLPGHRKTDPANRRVEAELIS